MRSPADRIARRPPRRARVVVMLTATPHSGDDEAFARLCALGDLGSAFPLSIFHRTRSTVGLPHGRRLVQLRVRPAREEDAMHRVLDRYVQRLTDEGAPGAMLVASILTRRACSSAWSLARSVERRMALLSATRTLPRDQLPLPFVDAGTDEEPADELGIVGLRDSAEEIQWLQPLAERARLASAAESKP